MIQRCIFCGKEFEARNKTQYLCKGKHITNCCICGKEIEVTNKQIVAHKNKLDSFVCSEECSHKKAVLTKFEKNNGNYRSEETNRKIKETSKQRYGGIGFASKELSDKSWETYMKKNNTDEKYKFTEEHRQKIYQTNLERYGHISPFGNKEVQEKIKQTIRQKYDVDRPFKSKEIQQKCRQTLIDTHRLCS